MRPIPVPPLASLSQASGLALFLRGECLGRSHPVGNGDGPGSPSLRICLDTRRVQRGPWAPMQAGMLILSRVEGGSAVLVPAFGHPGFSSSLKCFCSLLRTRALQPQSFPVRRSIVLHGKLVCFLARATVLACSQASKEFVYTSLHQPLKPIGNRSASSCLVLLVKRSQTSIHVVQARLTKTPDALCTPEFQMLIIFLSPARTRRRHNDSRTSASAQPRAGAVKARRVLSVSLAGVVGLPSGRGLLNDYRTLKTRPRLWLSSTSQSKLREIGLVEN